jgi:hypothetical protein
MRQEMERPRVIPTDAGSYEPSGEEGGVETILSRGSGSAFLASAWRLEQSGKGRASLLRPVPRVALTEGICNDLPAGRC